MRSTIFFGFIALLFLPLPMDAANIDEKNEIIDALIGVHNANCESHGTENRQNNPRCVVCEIREASMFCYVCDHDRCYDCFNKGSKIKCPYCSKLKRKKKCS